MRYKKNIFEEESCQKIGHRNMSSTTIATIILSLISIFLAIQVIVNFNEITKQIAILIAKLLSSGFLVLLVVTGSIYLITRVKRKIYRGFWR